MSFLTRLAFPVDFPASINVLTVVQQPPRCDLKPAVPLDGITFLGSGNSTLILMLHYFAASA